MPLLPSAGGFAQPAVRELGPPTLSRAHDAIERTYAMTVAELFGGHSHADVLFIPLYQRRYEWTKKQTTELLDAIYSAATPEMVEDDRPTSYARREVFVLSSVVCTVQPIDPDHSYAKDCGVLLTQRTEVVDGQQRVTTLLLMLSVMRSFAAQRAQELLPTLTVSKHRTYQDYIKAIATIEELMFVSLSGVGSSIPVRIPRLLPLDITNDAEQASEFIGPRAILTKPVLMFDETEDVVDTTNVYRANFVAMSNKLVERLPGLPENVADRNPNSYAIEATAFNKLLDYLQNSVVVIYVQPNPSYAQQLFDVVNTPGQPLDSVARFRFALFRSKVTKSMLASLANAFNPRTDFNAFHAITHAYSRAIDKFECFNLADDLSVPQNTTFYLVLRDVLAGIESGGGLVKAQSVVTKNAQIVGKYFLDGKELYDRMETIMVSGPQRGNAVEQAIWEFGHMEVLAHANSTRIETEEEKPAHAKEFMLSLRTTVKLWRPLSLALMADADLTLHKVGGYITGNKSKFDAVANLMREALIVQLGSMLDPQRRHGVSAEIRTEFVRIMNVSKRVKVPSAVFDWNTAILTFVTALRLGIHSPLYERRGYAFIAAKHILRRVEQLLQISNVYIADFYGHGGGWHIEHLTAQCIAGENWNARRAAKDMIIHAEEDYDFWVKHKALHRLGNLAVLEGEANTVYSSLPLKDKLDKISTELAPKYATFNGVREFLPRNVKSLRPVSFGDRHVLLASKLYEAYGLADGTVPIEVVVRRDMEAALAGSVDDCHAGVGPLAASPLNAPSETDAFQLRRQASLVYVELELALQANNTAADRKSLEEQFYGLSKTIQAPYKAWALSKVAVDTNNALGAIATENVEVAHDLVSYNSLLQCVEARVGYKLAAAGFEREPVPNGGVRWVIPNRPMCPFSAVLLQPGNRGYHTMSIALPHRTKKVESIDDSAFPSVEENCFVRVNVWEDLVCYRAVLVPDAVWTQRMPANTPKKRRFTPDAAVTAAEHVIARFRVPSPKDTSETAEIDNVKSSKRKGAEAFEPSDADEIPDAVIGSPALKVRVTRIAPRHTETVSRDTAVHRPHFAFNMVDQLTLNRRRLHGGEHLFLMENSEHVYWPGTLRNEDMNLASTNNTLADVPVFIVGIKFAKPACPILAVGTFVQIELCDPRLSRVWGASEPSQHAVILRNVKVVPLDHPLRDPRELATRAGVWPSNPPEGRPSAHERRVWNSFSKPFGTNFILSKSFPTLQARSMEANAGYEIWRHLLRVAKEFLDS